MKKIIPFLGLLLTCSSLKAQDSKWAISFTPAVVISSDLKYAFQPGIEYSFNDRLSLLTEVAFIPGGRKDLSFSNSKYFRIKPELRYHLRESKHGLRTYVGFQTSYTYRKWENVNGGCYFDKNMYADSISTYNKASISSPILTSSLQLGTPFSFGNHFVMDIFMGLGMRMIFTKYSNVENATKDGYFMPSCKIFPAPAPAYSISGTVKRFHCNFGVRFLYRL
ncbi:MAG: DUF3575 domain-containing protein [Chitinophagales bacterium]